MIGSLVRLLGLGDTPGAASATRFAPRLEMLDGRTMPSVVVVVDGVGGLPGGVFASDATSGVVDNGGASAYAPQESISLNDTRRSGEEVPALLTKATPILF